MRAFPNVRDFIFRVRYGFRGVPFQIDDRTVRLDESLRRCDARNEYQVQRAIIENLNVGDGMLDVGANFGLHTLLAGFIVGSTGEVHALEPLPSNLKKLRRHVRLNHLESVVHIAPTAVSDAPESEVTFFSGGEDLGVTASLTSSGGNTLQVTVPNTTLDDYLPKIGRPVRLIKIDVEGAELKVLRGGQKLLEKYKPLLVIEVHAFAFPSFNTSLREFRAFLNGCGYDEEILPGTTLQNGLHYQAVYRHKNS
jgi:FkbM family methyltransferase